MAHIFDTHAHYTSEQFDPDRENILDNLQSQNVSGVIECGTDYTESIKCIALAERYNFIYAAVGLHPECTDDATEDEIEKLESLLTNKKVVAIGEIGLDYHWETERDRQKEMFIAQLEMAKRHNLPVILHDREAHEDMQAIIKNYDIKKIMHCYSGSAEMARQLLESDIHFGFGGALTFKNAKKAVCAAELIPLSRILLETDCPYMTPVPFRGTRNNSALIANVAEVLANIKGVSVERVLEITEQNAREVFGI
ncbi:MAG: TatD family hydrolase [Oscillospiraceae bacterium]